jgi:carboxyl-terminal processing protease
MRSRLFLAALALLPLAGRALAGDGKRAPQDGSGTAPVSSVLALKTPHLERTRRVVLEVIDKIATTHLRGEDSEEWRKRLREEAIEALRHHVGSLAFKLLEGDAREKLHHALAGVARGDLDACLAVLDEHLAGPRTSEEIWTVTDVLARGAIAATGDPFTRFTDEKTLARLALLMTGDRTKGYGFNRLVDKDGMIAIDHVQKGYDAADKGLQDGDSIVEVDGRPALLIPRDELIRRLVGTPEGKVSIRVFRDGFVRGHDVELEARLPQGQNVEGDFLGNAIGYVRLNSFIEKTGEELEGVVRTLERQGARSLILDVRDNPGGTVKSCAAVARVFLGGGKVVCTTQQRDGKAEPILTEGDAAPLFTGSVVVLTNGASASASEMLALALRDHLHSRLVGTRTFGKGVGQSPVPLSSTSERFLLLTTMQYVGKAGTSPQKVGIAPDLEVPAFALTTAEQEEIMKLSSARAFDEYLEMHEGPDAEALLAIARDDGGSVDRYPGFEAWRRGLDVRPDALRRVLRATIRNWAVKTHGHTFHEDLRDDAPLRKAIELLGELPPPPTTAEKPPAPVVPAPVKPEARPHKRVWY